MSFDYTDILDETLSATSHRLTRGHLITGVGVIVNVQLWEKYQGTEDILVSDCEIFVPGRTLTDFDIGHFHYDELINEDLDEGIRRILRAGTLTDGTQIYHTILSRKVHNVQREIREFLDYTGLIGGGTSPIPVLHNTLTGIQGGQAGEYYHLNYAQWSDLTGGTTLQEAYTAGSAGQQVVTLDATRKGITFRDKNPTIGTSETLFSVEGPLGTTKWLQVWGTGEVQINRPNCGQGLPVAALKLYNPTPVGVDEVQISPALWFESHMYYDGDSVPIEMFIDTTPDFALLNQHVPIMGALRVSTRIAEGDTIPLVELGGYPDTDIGGVFSKQPIFMLVGMCGDFIAGGPGGQTVVKGGQGTGANNGGDVYIEGGDAGESPSVDGAVWVGATSTTAVNLGAASAPIYLNGQVSTDVIFTNAGNHNLYVAASTVDVAGKNLYIHAGNTTGTGAAGWLYLDPGTEVSGTEGQVVLGGNSGTTYITFNGTARYGGYRSVFNSSVYLFDGLTTAGDLFLDVAAPTEGNINDSKAVIQRGRYFPTGGAGHYVDYRNFVNITVNSTPNPEYRWAIETQIDDGGYTEAFSVGRHTYGETVVRFSSTTQSVTGIFSAASGMNGLLQFFENSVFKAELGWKHDGYLSFITSGAYTHIDTPQLLIYNTTAISGVTTIKVQAGAGQSTTELFGIYANNGTDALMRVGYDGAGVFASSVTCTAVQGGAASLSGFATGQLIFNSGSTNVLGGFFQFTASPNRAEGSVQPVVAILPTIAQGSTSGYTALLVNPTESSIGTGTNLLLDLSVASVPKFTVDRTGVATAAGFSGPFLCTGLTTTGLSSGDAVQILTNLVATKAINTSPSAVVGIYSGITGAIVTHGPVIATFATGPTTAGEAVYLSTVAGQLTNVKPTGFYIHEMGVTIDTATRKVLLQPKPIVSLPAGALAWVRTTQAPLGMEEAGTAYHPTRKLAVCYLAWNLSGSGVSATLTYDPVTNTWTNLSDATPGSKASVRSAMCYVASTDSVYMWGAQAAGGGGRKMWRWNGGPWIECATGGPANSATANVAYDSTHGVIVVYSSNSTTTYEYNPVADTWSSSYSTGDLPDHYEYCQMVYYPTIDKTVWFGSDSGAWTYLYNQPTHTWSRISSGLSGSSRYLGAMYYDSLRGVVQLAGGISPGGTKYKEVWSFDGALWTKTSGDLSLPGAQTGVYNASGCFAPELNMGLVLGGTYWTGGVGNLYANEGTW